MAMAMSILRGAAEPRAPGSGPWQPVRLALWLATLALIAALMLRHSLADVVRPFDVALAVRIDPTNAQAASSRAEQLLRDDPSRHGEAEILARQALRRSPVSASGARMLATARDLAGDAAAARRLMAYSERLSRRDLPTQLWLIEDAVARNDIAGALHHYDIALRSSDATKALLFPTLIKAIAQPPVVEQLIVTLAARPTWADPFIESASREASDLDGLAAMYAGLARRGFPLSDVAVAQASARMIDAERFTLAWRIYAASHPASARLALRDPDFAQAGSNTGRFEWILPAADGLIAGPRAYDHATGLGYSAATGAGGAVARQLLILGQGDFVLSGRILDRSPNSPPVQVHLSCAGGGQSIATIQAASARFFGRFTVPPICPAQWVEIMVDGGDNPLGSSGVIGGLRIVPAARPRF